MTPSTSLLVAGGILGMITDVAAAPGAVTFSGSVVDAAGRPVGGASVVVQLWDPPRWLRDWYRRPTLHRTEAAGDGSFRLGVPVSGEEWTAAVVVLKAGHGPGGEEINAPGRTTGLRLALTRPSSVAGRVVDRSGQPVAGVQVRVRWAVRLDQDGVLSLEAAGPYAFTDERGRFRLAPIPDRASLALAAEHPHFAPGVSSPRDAFAGSDDVLLSLAPLGSLSGRVVDEEGQPVPGVTVRCENRVGAPREARTDGDGRFQFGGLRAGNYVLQAASPGPQTDRVTDLQGVMLPEGGQAHCPDLRIVRAGEVSGRLTDEKGQPLAGVEISARREVELAPRMFTQGDSPSARTGADGSYRLRLPPGQWQVRAELYPEGALGEDEHRPEPGVRVAAGENTHLDLTLPAPVRLRARVLDADGRPVAGAWVQVNKGGLLETHRTDDAGRFGVLHLAPTQAARLLVFDQARTQGVKQEVTPGEVRGELVLRLRRLPVVTGVVRDKGGAPVPDARVGADRVIRLPFAEGREMTNRAATGPDGRFSLALFPDAEYRVRAGAWGFAPTAEVTVDLPPAGRKGLAPLQFALERADGFVAGVVVDEEGKPVPGAGVGAEVGRAFVGQATTDAQGRFRIDRLPPGTITVNAGAVGFQGEWRQNVKVGSTSVRLVLSPIDVATPPVVPPAVGAPAPEISVAQWVNGEGVRSLEELRGKTVVLQFSSAYNAAAKETNAALKALDAGLKARGRADVVILAIYDASIPAEEVARYVREEGLPFPIGIVAPTRSHGVDRTTFQAYGVRQLPTLFVIDGKGTVQSINPTGEALMRLVATKEAP
jgi:protocatechuate 3,4-dioxygenase beta subunit